jgi:hypothetical protein
MDNTFEQDREPGMEEGSKKEIWQKLAMKRNERKTFCNRSKSDKT